MALQKKHVEMALARLSEGSFPSENKPSTKWDLIDPKSGERFPPKAVLRMARIEAGLSTDRLPGGGWPTNDPLRKLGFQIIPKGEVVSPGAQLAQDLASIDNSVADPTTKSQLIEARLGQGKFRNELLSRWRECCPITKCRIPAVLRASHIKPWRDSENGERLDPANGLLLAATVDALFDRSLITFQTDGSMLVSSDISSSELDLMAIPHNVLLKIPYDSERYMVHHRQNFLERTSGFFYKR